MRRRSNDYVNQICLSVISACARIVWITGQTRRILTSVDEQAKRDEALRKPHDGRLFRWPSFLSIFLLFLFPLVCFRHLDSGWIIHNKEYMGIYLYRSWLASGDDDNNISFSNSVAQQFLLENIIHGLLLGKYSEFLFIVPQTGFPLVFCVC